MLFHLYIDCFLYFLTEIIHNERDLVNTMHQLAASSNCVGFLEGLQSLLHRGTSARNRIFNDLLACTKALIGSIAKQMLSLINQGQEMFKSPRNIADTFDEGSPKTLAFREKLAALINRLDKATSRARRNVQKLKESALRSQMKKHRAGLSNREEEHAISIYDAFQNCLVRLARISNEVCLGIFGSFRCVLEKIDKTEPISG